MKRKLVYDDNEEACQNGNSRATKMSHELDYEPTFFLRCHSRKNDPADVRTQVWQCAFEPSTDNPNKTTKIVATCGGNSICLINVKTGEVAAKFTSNDQREMFYSIAWTTLLVMSGDPPQMNILAAAGARSMLHLIYPDGGVAFLEHQIVKSSKVIVSSLLFHPKNTSILFCAMSDGRVLAWDIGSPGPPNYDTKLKHLLTLESRSEVFTLVYSTHANILMAASNTGVCGWILTQKDLAKKRDRNLSLIKFQFPKKNRHTPSSEPQLVDSLELVRDDVVATKCALHGAIYLWKLKSALPSGGDVTVVPTHVLHWSDTDNYFMNMGCHPDAGLLACGDDRGALWLYNLRELSPDNRDVQPSLVLDWPAVTDSYVDKNRKLRLGVYDIVVDKVVVSYDGKYLVAVTSNNMVCIWRRLRSK